MTTLLSVAFWCSGGSGRPWEWRYTPFIGVWLIAGLAVGSYVLAHKARVDGMSHRINRRRTWYLAAGLIVIVVSSEWPMGALGAGYLASAGALRTVLYSLVAAPLLLASMPPWLLRWLLRPRPVAAVARGVTRWWVAFAQYNVVLVLVSAPVVVDALKVTQAGSFLLDAVLLASALLAWWPVFGPLEEVPRLGDPGRALYLVAQTIVPTIPASFLTFASFPLYRLYELAPPVWLEFTKVQDQQLAGLLTKILGGFILLGYITALFFNWAARERQETTTVHPATIRRGLQELEEWRRRT